VELLILHSVHKKHNMGLKEKLLENKALNEENQFKVSEQQSNMPYELGYDYDTDQEVNYDSLYQPYVHEYADLQLKLDTGKSEYPAQDRQRVKDITGSVEVIREALENVMGTTEVWNTAVILSGGMGGVDLMGTPPSRYKSINILADELKGVINILAVDDDITKLAWDIYDDEVQFIERIYLSKLNKLSQTQGMFIKIPDTAPQNNDFKKLSSEIFESKQIGQDSDNKALTGGVTESYRKIKEDGSLELISKKMKGGMEQQFYIVDKQAIRNSMQFQAEMNKITAGLVGSHQSSDEVIAFNNNILAEVTSNYLTPGQALKPKQLKTFQEDYKTWFLEKEVAKEIPYGEPVSSAKGLSKEENALAAEEEEVESQEEEAMV